MVKCKKISSKMDAPSPWVLWYVQSCRSEVHSWQCWRAPRGPYHPSAGIGGTTARRHTRRTDTERGRVAEPCLAGLWEGEDNVPDTHLHRRAPITTVLHHLWGSRHTWVSAGRLDLFGWCRWPSAAGRRLVLYNLSKECLIWIQGSATDGKLWSKINVKNVPACMFVYSAPKCLHWNPYTGPRSPSSRSVNPRLSRKAREPLASQIFTPFSESSLAFVDPCRNTRIITSCPLNLANPLVSIWSNSQHLYFF